MQLLIATLNHYSLLFRYKFTSSNETMFESSLTLEK